MRVDKEEEKKKLETNRTTRSSSRLRFSAPFSTVLGDTPPVGHVLPRRGSKSPSRANTPIYDTTSNGGAKKPKVRREKRKKLNEESCVPIPQSNLQVAGARVDDDGKRLLRRPKRHVGREEGIVKVALGLELLRKLYTSESRGTRSASSSSLTTRAVSYSSYLSFPPLSTGT